MARGYPTPKSNKKTKKLRKGLSKRKAFDKKNGLVGTKNTSVTFQHDRGTEYRSKPMSKRARANKRFNSKVLKAVLGKMAPNYMLINKPSFNLFVGSNVQNFFSCTLWGSRGNAGSNDDIFKIYQQVGGPSSVTQGYDYDLYMHYGILEVDMCLETTLAQVSQGLVDVYTFYCRKDVINEGVVTTSGKRFTP